MCMGHQSSAVTTHASIIASAHQFALQRQPMLQLAPPPASETKAGGTETHEAHHAHDGPSVPPQERLTIGVCITLGSTAGRIFFAFALRPSQVRRVDTLWQTYMHVCICSPPWLAFRGYNVRSFQLERPTCIGRSLFVDSRTEGQANNTPMSRTPLHSPFSIPAPKSTAWPLRPQPSTLPGSAQ